MVAWIVLCSVWFNFVLGALVPITPKLNEEMAGVAFSSFALVKVLFFFPVGMLGDRIGHFAGFFLALLAQALTLALILFFPDLVWLARSTEGLTLAFGTLSALSLLRSYASNESSFAKFISMLIGIGSSGFLFGPFLGYNLNAILALQILLGISILICFLHWAFYQSHLQQTKNLVFQNKSDFKFPWILVLCYGLVKGLGEGMQPLLGWWATAKIGLSAEMAGFTFIAAAIGFMLGNVRPRWEQAMAGLLGLILIELALQGQALFWWPALFFLGLFSGTSVNLCLSRLGWNKLENLGTQNSKWLVLSDIPMTIMPALLWSLRGSNQVAARIFVLMSFMLSVLFLLKRKV